MVKDFSLRNEAVFPIHALIKNPFNLLPNVPPATSNFTVLDLKDAFFFLLSLYTLTHNSSLSSPGKTLTLVLKTANMNCSPSGLLRQPHYFGHVLAQDLSNFDPGTSMLLQYFEDLSSPSLSLSL